MWLLRLRIVAFLALPTCVMAHAHTGTAYGQPAQASQATRTIQVEASDQMRLIFSTRDIREGDIVRFVVHNSGKLTHEFAIADATWQRQHQAAMRAMPDMPEMQHHGVNVITLAPGQTKTIVWAFTHLKQHHLVFACNVPGHAEAGMVQRLDIR